MDEGRLYKILMTQTLSLRSGAMMIKETTSVKLR
jgi:hypothetical protein